MIWAIAIHEQLAALLDANVLYPAPVRDLLLQLTVTDINKAKWTRDIHREWIESLLGNEPQRDRAALERTRDRMDSKTRDCLIIGYESLIPSLVLPDPEWFGRYHAAVSEAATYVQRTRAGPDQT